MTKIDKFLFWAPIQFIGMLYIFYRLLNPIKSPYSWLIHFGMGFVQGLISAMTLNIFKLYFHL